jgi:hypothetical protein
MLVNCRSWIYLHQYINSFVFLSAFFSDRCTIFIVLNSLWLMYFYSNKFNSNLPGLPPDWASVHGSIRWILYIILFKILSNTFSILLPTVIPVILQVLLFPFPFYSGVMWRYNHSSGGRITKILRCSLTPFSSLTTILLPKLRSFFPDGEPLRKNSLRNTLNNSLTWSK